MVHLDDPGVVDATQQQRFSPKVAHEILARHRRQQNLHGEDGTLLALPSRSTVRARPRVSEAHRLEYSRVAPLVDAILKFQADLCGSAVGKGIGSAERRDERDDGERFCQDVHAGRTFEFTSERDFVDLADALLLLRHSRPRRPHMTTFSHISGRSDRRTNPSTRARDDAERHDLAKRTPSSSLLVRIRSSSARRDRGKDASSPSPLSARGNPLPVANHRREV